MPLFLRETGFTQQLLRIIWRAGLGSVAIYISTIVRLITKDCYRVKGSTSRTDFWVWISFVALSGSIMLISLQSIPSVLFWIASLLILFSTSMLAIRRFHDIGKPWTQAIYFLALPCSLLLMPFSFFTPAETPLSLFILPIIGFILLIVSVPLTLMNIYLLAMPGDDR